jgi:Uma2 family endonuclease
MAAVALDPAYRRVSVEEFLEMDFGGARAELEDGLIYLMAGGSEQHARIALNISTFLRVALRGSGCRPYGSDFATRTGERNVRLPDVSVYCGNPQRPENARLQLIGDPVVVMEVLSPSTRSHDEKVKVPEYRALAGVQAIVLVDADRERLQLIERQGADWHEHAWRDWDVHIAALGLTLPHAEVFARD